jgi:hypothetical protein
VRVCDDAYVQSVPIAWRDSHMVRDTTSICMPRSQFRLDERQFKAPKVLQFFFLNMKLLNYHLSQKPKWIEIVNLLI